MTTETHTPSQDTPLGAQQAATAASAEERPEVYVGAAFVGGLVLAKILKKLGRGD